jgi:RNA polymerase-binding transcription factor DksA
VLAALEQRDLARDGEERGDGHHHPAEAATDADLRERELREQLRWREREERLRAALAAIEAGNYGVCVDCGEEIPEGRLRALPDAVRCVCQRVASRRPRRPRRGRATPAGGGMRPTRGPRCDVEHDHLPRQAVAYWYSPSRSGWRSGPASAPAAGQESVPRSPRPRPRTSARRQPESRRRARGPGSPAAGRRSAS